MGNRSGLKARGAFHALVGFILSVSATQGLGVTRTVIDFDGTINHDQGPDAAWRTDWILYRITSRTVGGQPSVMEFPPFADGEGPELPPTFAISYGEYRKYVAKLGKEGEALGDLRAYPLFADPLWKQRPATFIPGYYRVSPDVTFQRFRPHPDSDKSFLVEDFEDAVKRVKASKGAMRLTGRAFPLFEAALTRPDLSAGVAIFTSRWQLDWEWEALIDRMWATGILRHNGKKGRPKTLAPWRVHSLSGPDSLFYSRGSLAQRKAEALVIEAATLIDGPLALKKHDEIVVDPVGARHGETAKMNTLIAAEDDPVYVAAVGAQMAKMSGDLGYAQNVKFVLFNAGSDADVAGGRWPWRWTVFHQGFGREALPEEIQLWTGRTLPDCKALLAGDWVQGAP